MEKTSVMAYFAISGDEFPIDYVTETLGIEPTITYKKGDVIVRPHNPNVISTETRFRIETNWELSTGYQESYDINEQLYFILNQINHKTQELNLLRSKYDISYLFMVVIKVENNESPAMHLESSLIKFASSINAEIAFDLYINS
jgi:Domain of unknown function (DUF4279)